MASRASSTRAHLRPRRHGFLFMPLNNTVTLRPAVPWVMHRGRCLLQASHGAHVWCWDWQYPGYLEASASLGWGHGLARSYFRGFHTVKHVLLQAGGYAAFGRGAKARGRAGERAAGDGEAAVMSPKRAKLGALNPLWAGA